MISNYIKILLKKNYRRNCIYNKFVCDNVAFKMLNVDKN